MIWSNYLTHQELSVNTIHLFVSKLKFFDNCIWVEIGFPHRFIVESPKGFYLLEKGINWMMIYSQ